MKGTIARRGGPLATIGLASLAASLVLLSAPAAEGAPATAPSPPIVIKTDVVNPASNPVHVTGVVTVSNLPAVQDVHVNNLPAVQEVAGEVTVGNLPAVQDVAGLVGIDPKSNVVGIDPKANTVKIEAGEPLPVVLAGAAAAPTPVQSDLIPGSLTYVVPTGKRLVIEFVSVHTGSVAAAPPGEEQFFEVRIGVTAGGVSVDHFLVLQRDVRPGRPLPFVADQYRYTASQEVRLYADPGSSVALINNCSGGCPGEVAGTMSGYLVDV
jgi:hypothetical protein